MPFVSESQRKWMHANEPAMAKRWEKHTPKGKRLPKKKVTKAAAAMSVLQRIGSGLIGVGKLGGPSWAKKVDSLRVRAAAGDKRAQDIMTMLGVASMTLGAGAGVGLGRLMGSERTGMAAGLGSAAGILPAAFAPSGPPTPVLLPVDSKREEATMGPEKRAMQKAADLMKLDAKGISPPALTSIMQGQLHTALQHPGMTALVARRRERLRRLKEEIQNPGMHIKPEKPPAGPLDAAAAGPPGMMPMAPGNPPPPSNHLGMFPAGGMPGAPAGAGMQLAADILRRFVKRANGAVGAESAAGEAEESLPPAVTQELANTVVTKSPGIDDERDVHGKAEELGVDPHEAEEELYRLLASLLGGKNDLIPGGKAEGMPTSQFPSKQLQAARAIESEHTDNPALQTEIGKDHLVEASDYYEPRLANMETKMESDLKAGKTKGVSAVTKAAARARAFKYGFFRKVAECGLRPKQFEERMLKHAASLVMGGPIGGAAAGARAAGGGVSWLGEKLKAVAKTGLIAPIALSVPLLFGLGMAGRHLMKPEYETPEELRSIERVALYKRLGREARKNARRLQQRRQLRLEARGEKPKEPEVKVPELKRVA